MKTTLKFFTGLVGFFLLSSPLQAGDDLSNPCEGRERCQIVKTHNAGQDPKTSAIHVVETFVENKPHHYEPYSECGRLLDKPGGQEFWRVMTSPDGRVTLDPQPIFALCNDGYGASGVGEDKVIVGPNTIRHVQSGGSGERWERDETYSLSPLQITAWRECGWHTSLAGGHSIAGTISPLMIRVWNLPYWDPDRKNQEQNLVFGCPDTTNPSKATGLVMPIVPFDGDVPAETFMGSCGMLVDRITGYSILGQADQTFFKTVLSDDGSLIVQVYDPDPLATPPKSWVNDDHIELWVTDPEYQDDKGFWQIGVRLRDGVVKKGYGAPAELPTVRRWEAVDDKGRRVTVLHLKWTTPEILTGAQGFAQMGLVYAEGQDGKTQHRMLATVPLKYADARTLGGTAHVPARCGVRGGRLEITEQDPPNLNIAPLP